MDSGPNGYTWSRAKETVRTDERACASNYTVYNMFQFGEGTYDGWKRF